MEAQAAGASVASVVWRCGTAVWMGEGGKGDGERAQHGGEELRLLARQLGTVEETARKAAVAPVEVEKAEELRQRGERDPPRARRACSACCRGPTAGVAPSARRGDLECMGRCTMTLLRDVLRRCDVGGVMELRLLRGELVTACGEKGFNLRRHHTRLPTAAMPLVVRSHVIPNDWM